MHFNPSNSARPFSDSGRVALAQFTRLIVLLMALVLSGCASGALDADAALGDADAAAPDAGEFPQDVTGADASDALGDLDTRETEDTQPPADATPDADTIDPTPDIVDPGDEDITNPPDTQQPDVTLDDCPD